MGDKSPKCTAKAMKQKADKKVRIAAQQTPVEAKPKNV
jgi:hypothetical protein